MYTEERDDFSFCRPYLTAGEAVLWKGRPEKGKLFAAQDILLIPFSILWCGFAIFWEIMVIANGAPFFFALFGVPFVCVGLYLVFGRFIWTAYIRKRTFYVITNKKIIRTQGSKVDMLDGKTLPAVRLIANKDGSGTIRFGQEPVYYRRNSYRSFDSSHGLFALENIPDVVRVHQLISNMDR